MDRLEELGTRCYSEQIRLRAIRQAEELPHQGLPQINAMLFVIRSMINRCSNKMYRNKRRCILRLPK